MTALVEAKLCREAEISYGVLAMATDYDCWKDEHVTVDVVVATMEKNVTKAQQVIEATIPKILAYKVRLDCACNPYLATQALLLSLRVATCPSATRLKGVIRSFVACM